MKRSPIIRKTPLRSRKPMRRVSKRRAKESKIRNAEWPEFLEKHPRCEIRAPGICTGLTQCRHHRKGRIGSNFIDPKYQRASCYSCNAYLETFEGKLWGKQHGHRLDRLGNL